MKKERIILTCASVGATLGFTYYLYSRRKSINLALDFNVKKQRKGIKGAIASRIPAADESDSLYQWIKQIPKIELHAHLHGSVRDETIFDLMKLHPERFTQDDIDTIAKERTLDDVWKVFGIVHRCVTSREAVKRITTEMIEDFAAENVKYLEIRTTPRALPDSNLDMEGYVEAVIEAIKECDVRPDLSIRVNLILSVNRSNPKPKARATLDICLRYRKKGIVGLDFSGPPVNTFSDFYDVFREAQLNDLKTTVHCAEWLNDEDTKLILDFKPNRLGHFIQCGDDLFQRCIEEKHPVEICPSSNLVTEMIPDISKHPFGRYPEGHPLSMCTDDSGVFHISLTHEIYIIAKAFGLSKERIRNMITESVEMTFQKPKFIKRLRKTIIKGFDLANANAETSV